MGFGYGHKVNHGSTARNIATGEVCKKVFDNSMVAHVWAQKVQTFGQSNNGNFYFEGPTLYSYGMHFICGHILESGVVLLTTEHASVTTSGHMSDARGAVRGRDVYNVPELTELKYDLKGGPSESRNAALTRHVKKHAAAYADESAVAVLIEAGHKPGPKLAAMVAGWRAEIVKADTAAKARRDKAANVANLDRAKRVATATDSEFAAHVAAVMGRTYFRDNRGRKANEIYGDGPAFKRDLLTYQRAAKAKGWTRMVATISARRMALGATLALFQRKAERKAANEWMRGRLVAFRAWLAQLSRGEALSGYDYQQFAVVCSHLTGSFMEGGRRAAGMTEAGAAKLREMGTAATAEHRRVMEIEAAAYQAKREREAAERHAKEAANRAAWLAGESVPGFRGSDEKGRALIRAERVERDASGAVIGGVLRTSHGAEVPLDHAIRAFGFVKLCHDTGRTWHANGRTIRVGHFTISEVRPDGFTAGCHVIGWPECERLATALGVAAMAPNESALVASH